MKQFKNNLIAISGKKGSGKDEVAMIIKYLTWRKIRRYEDTPTATFPEISLKHYEIYKNSLTPDSSLWEIKKYADKLKDIVCLLIGCTREELEDRDFKEKGLPSEWSKWSVSSSEQFSTEFISKEAAKLYGELVMSGNDPVVVEVPLTPRLFLQLLGTEGGRKVIHEDMWVNATFADFKEDKKAKDEAHYFLSEKPNDEKALKYIDDNHLALPHWLITDCRFPNEARAVLDRGGFVIRVERPGQSTDDAHLSETALDGYDEFSYTITNDSDIMGLIEKVTKCPLWYDD